MTPARKAGKAFLFGFVEDGDEDVEVVKEKNIQKPKVPKKKFSAAERLAAEACEFTGNITASDDVSIASSIEKSGRTRRATASSKSDFQYDM